MSEYYFKVKIPEFYDLLDGSMAYSLATRLSIYKKDILGVYVNVITDYLIFAFADVDARDKMFNFLKVFNLKSLRYASVADLPVGKEVN